MCNGNIENQKEALDGQVMDSINLILSNHFEVYHRENWPGYDELYIYTKWAKYYLLWYNDSKNIVTATVKGIKYFAIYYNHYNISTIILP